MSQKDEKPSSPPPYKKYPPGSQQRPKAVPLQSEQPHSSISGPFFAGARNFDITGGSFHNAARDIHHTVNNDHSTKSDFNNDYRNATRYDGAHNDYKGSTNYHGAHNDYKGSVHYNGSSDDHKGEITKNNYSGRSTGRLDYPPEQIYLSRSNPGYAGRTDGFYNKNDYEYREDDEPGRGRERREYQEDMITQHERNTDRNSPKEETEKSEAQGKTVEDGAAELRQCVETFMAGWPKEKIMSDLADKLIEEGWDRETVAHSDWGDIKEAYKGPGWTPPMFVRLKKICRKWYE